MSHVAGVSLPLGLHVSQAGSKYGNLILLGLIRDLTEERADFVLQPPKSGFNTVRLEQVRTDCFSRQAHGSTLGHIFFGF